jgi:hypothetical protein
MQFNLFNWIREGVKRSVMLGVADAIEEVGAPANSPELQASLNNFLTRTEAPLEGIAATATVGGDKSAGRKRLGRSLKDMGSAKS